ncbi:thioredoxin [Celeribacter marinus]|uniref:Thioredoxin n=1 Tax=Celeribacter marinus TaxID=1397108 RepID=A0A0N9ZH19_9RHOB|nr:thioredoxin [Celeribacter marinus]ALI55868.1 thioredoxin domain-containing protein EC-YbbN [Celeribacter marinus]SFK89566.1 thioredoxin [Celeribacter marinus]
MDFGQATPAPSGANIYDVSEADFMAKVIDASQETPVIVDFWAPWCGPCKTLGPALEAAVTAAGGKVKMAKINVDENQGIAGQMRVQSIPTVFAFYQGKPVDGFQGALPQSEIDAFVTKVADMNEEDGGLADAIEAAEAMLAEGELDDALETFTAILEEDPNAVAAFAGLAKCHVAKGDFDAAEAVLNGAPADVATGAAIEAVQAQIALAREAENAGPVDELRAKVAADPADMAAKLELATALHGTGDVAGAVDVLLDAVRADRDWNEAAAKTQLFKIFDALAPNDKVALDGRRKLSSILFA